MTNNLFLITVLLVFWGASDISLAGRLDHERDSLTLSADGHDFPVQYYYDKTGFPQGGLIVTYHGSGSHLVNNLGFVLSQYGWAVLLVRMDAQVRLPKRTFYKIRKTDGESTKETSSAEGESDNQAAVPDVKAVAVIVDESGSEFSFTVDQAPEISAASKLTQVIDFMEQKQGLFNLVFMSIDKSWEAVHKFVESKPPQLANVQGLILLNVKNYFPLKDLPQALPILDLNSNRVLGEVYVNRKFNAKRFKVTNYKQIHLHTPHWNHEFKQDRLVKRIRGWLSINIKGMEIDKR